MALKQSQQDLTKFLDCITCHAFNKDRSQVVLCPNNQSIEIYNTNGSNDAKKWEKIHTINEHGGLVSDLDWCHESNRILSCGHDRNAYVWNYDAAANEWKPTLCVLRINRAAIAAKWSPSGKKFAVASGSKTVPVCYYEKSSDWWVSRIVRKHKSSVVNVAWSPNSRFIVTASTDLKCRIISAFDPKLDQKDDSYNNIWGDEQYEFGEVLAEFDAAKAWVNCCAWAPGGKRLVFFGHGSTAHFVDLDRSLYNVQTVYTNNLPMLDCYFVDDNTVVAAGYDCNPAVFKYDEETEEWKFKEFFEKAEQKKVEEKKATATSAAFAMFAGATGQNRSFGAADTPKPSSFTTHKAQITQIKPVPGSTTFSTSGTDGRIETWDAKKFM
eukprot:UN01619